MPTFKIVFGLKDGSCVQKEMADPEASKLLGKNVSEKVSGDELGYPGYEFQITGGSDSSGFPMRGDIPGPGRKRILAIKGVGLKKPEHPGIRRRKTVSGAMISPRTVQINMKVLKEGAQPLKEPEKKEEQAEKAE